MSWLKVHDGTWMEPWVDRIGNEAFGIYVRLGSYCAQYLTDGLVPAAIVQIVAGGPGPLLDRLADAGLIEPSETGAVFLPRYLDDNPTRLQVEADREARKARAEKAAAARWGAGKNGRG